VAANKAFNGEEVTEGEIVEEEPFEDSEKLATRTKPRSMAEEKGGRPKRQKMMPIGASYLYYMTCTKE
jgi:hypothetical protein